MRAVSLQVEEEVRCRGDVSLVVVVVGRRQGPCPTGSSSKSSGRMMSVLVPRRKVPGLGFLPLGWLSKANDEALGARATALP